MARVARGLTALMAAAVLALTVACTPPTSDRDEDDPTPTPTPTPTPPPVHSAELRPPDQPTSVLVAADPVARAIATSEMFYASAPVAVVAAAGDAAAQLRAASVAVSLGAPLLLAAEQAEPAEQAGPAEPAEPAEPAPAAPAPAPESTDGLVAELERLGVLGVVTVGDVGQLDAELADLDDVAVLEAPDDDPALGEALRLDLAPVPLPEPGAELAAVIGLDRSAPSLPTGDAAEAPEPPAPEPPASEPPATTPATTPEPTPTRTPSSSPTPSPSADSTAETDAFPLTELADPLTGGLLLTTGDPGDLAAVATARSVGLDVLVVPSGDPRADTATVQAFAGAKPSTVVALGSSFGDVDTLTWKAATASTGVELPGGGQVLFPGRRFVALYGTPTYPALGILGEQDAAASIARAQTLAAEYQPLTDDVVVPAFEMIATVASAGPGDDGNYSNELPVETFIPWIEAAQAAGVYVVIDLQPGRTDFVTQARQYEPLLMYPNVGLALDPEWRLKSDQVHLRQIGSVHADEINAVAAYLAELTRTKALPQKLLVLHQFTHRMIQNRELVDTSHPELAVLIHADGQGSQGAKNGTWASLHQGAPAGVAWGWKNFIDEDVPMLDPVQTYQVEPAPQFVSYQ